MDWLELTVLTTTEGSELVSQLLIDAGAAGTAIEDKNDVALNQRPEGQWDIIDEEIARRMGDDVKVKAYYAMDARITDTLARVENELAALKVRAADLPLGKLETQISNVDDEDWAESWKKQYKPFRLGKHMVVKPGWEVYEAQEGDKIIEIDPGMAFGTGTHETTGMCVELIEQYMQPGMKAIDIGTGTGILAIAAALQGAGDVLATDLDPVAVRVAAENVRVNGFDSVIRTREGDLLQAVNETADIVIANIIADVIAMLAEPVRAHIEDGGMFICSGIARERSAFVLEALNKAGYHSLDIREKGEWMAIAARK
ncbi:MAG: 50S ribosomal protein L11 methyltransferase [Clostridiales bacterium]|nr:50S ribosomal protein L11 methyltransferase [Clostridiales bacterium]